MLYTSSRKTNLCHTIDLCQPCLLIFTLYLNGQLLSKNRPVYRVSNPDERRTQRLILGHSSECQMDSSGRLLLAITLRQHTGFTKEVMLVEQFNKFELCDKQTWPQ
jgi:MraZ protein